MGGVAWKAGGLKLQPAMGLHHGPGVWDATQGVSLSSTLMTFDDLYVFF